MIEYELQTVYKLSDWAESLSDSVDFIDYWYNLSLSPIKYDIESDIVNKINAFDWKRWQTDFEQEYQIKPGEGYDPELRRWFAFFTQHLVYVFQISSSDIALHYGKENFANLTNKWYQYHTFGVDHAINRFVDAFGLPPKAASFYAGREYMYKGRG